MRTVGEYLERAAEFNTLADRESDAVAKKRYIDLAESYRIMAKERERMIVDGKIKPAPPRELN